MIEYYSTTDCPLLLSHLRKFKSIFADLHIWHIHSGKWRRLNGASVFKLTISVNASSLQLYTNSNPSILKEIRVPVYPNLLHMNLKNNRIVSIQAIIFFKGMELRQLILSDNLITEGRVFRKAKLMSLRLIGLYANRLGSAKWVMELMVPDLEQIVLGLNCLSQIAVMNKVESVSLRSISLENNKVVSHRKQLWRWSNHKEIIIG